MKELTPIKHDRFGPAYSVDDVRPLTVKNIENGGYPGEVNKEVNKSMEQAAQTCKDIEKLFDTSVSKVMASQERLMESAKKVSQNVRKSGNELHEGLQRIEKVANFDRLERYVTVLERAAAALESLAALEKSGQLERIANAVKT